MIRESICRLKSYCESEQFKGWDPYDGLNSKVFQALPFLKNSALCRLVVIQGFKRSPINFRKIAMVPKDYNAKGIGLFLQGYCNLYKAVCDNQQLQDAFGTQAQLMDKINELAELLISLQSKGYSGACWGYNFDWQSQAFFLPAKTPTVVATSFAVEALLSAYDVTKKEEFLKVAVSSAEFILNDLNRIQKHDGYMFSYSPVDCRAVYNASLLGSKTLSLIYEYTGIELYKRHARITAKAVCDVQNPDGSFPHSDQVGNKWRDNFHTGFKLESLATYQRCCSDFSFNGNIERGYRYWLEHYFDHQTGLARYYDNTVDTDLVDLHCAAQAIPTVYKLGKSNEEYNLICKILQWASENMQNKDGSFCFQIRNKRKNKIRYMRWPNAWMFYGMSYFMLIK